MLGPVGNTRRAHPRIQAGQKEGTWHVSEIHPCPANSHGGEDAIANPSTPKCTENMRAESTAVGPPPCCLSKTWMPLLAPFGCQYNNGLYRTRLDRVSATNPCYTHRISQCPCCLHARKAILQIPGGPNKYPKHPLRTWRDAYQNRLKCTMCRKPLARAGRKYTQGTPPHPSRPKRGHMACL